MHPAMSADWPARPVTVIVPFPPGGNTDSMGRILAQKLGETFGRSFIVENRPGASGAIAMADVKRSAPDGYTLVFGAIQQISVLPYTQTVNYDPKKDFSYISIFGEGPLVFAVNSGFPAKSVTDFVRLREGHAGRHDVWLWRHIFGDTPRRGAIPQKSGSKSHSCSLPRRRSGGRGSARRASPVLLWQCLRTDPVGE